jgi:hypothetical protein
MILVLPIGLLSGCANPATEYCLITDYIPFGSQETVTHLMEHDKELVRGVVKHNEVRQRLCK